MADRLLIPVPGLGVLALAPAALATALQEGSAVGLACGGSGAAQKAPDERLYDADELAGQLGIAASWIEQKARERKIPSYLFGRWRRFRRSEVEAAVRVKGSGQ